MREVAFVSDYTLLFACPKCRWWIGGNHSSKEPIPPEKLAETTFDLKCEVAECGWTGQLLGSQAQPKATRN